MKLSTCAPFLALAVLLASCSSNRWFDSGDQRFHGLIDLLQYLGAFTFRDPAPA